MGRLVTEGALPRRALSDSAVCARLRAEVEAQVAVGAPLLALLPAREACRGGGARGLAGEPELRVDVREVALDCAGA